MLNQIYVRNNMFTRIAVTTYVNIVSMNAGYAEILRRVNLDTLNVRRDSICQKYFDKIKVGTHRLNYLLPDKRHIKYNVRQQNVYPLPVTRTNRFRNSFIPWALYNCQ